MTLDRSVVAVLVGFGHALRDAGLTVGSGQVTTYCSAAARLELADAEDLYWAGRVCLVSRHEDVPTFDSVFRRYFASVHHGLALTTSGVFPQRSVLHPTTTADLVRRSTAAAEERSEGATGTRASAAELLRHKHFRACTPDELVALAKLMAQLRLTPPMRRSRRTRPSRRGRVLDLRRTVRRTLRHGELVHPPWRQPRSRPRRLILILDVSGSMADYSRALLQFAHSAALPPTPRTEVFCFGTRLTRITRELRQRNPDQALAQAASAVLDWEGGTRIGDALTALRVSERRGLVRGSVVVICSDGLECGDPGALGLAMARLARLAYRIVWVNPLKGDPRYQPLARGMQAALPYVDVFVSGHDLSSLEELAALLPRLA